MALESDLAAQLEGLEEVTPESTFFMSSTPSATTAYPAPDAVVHEPTEPAIVDEIAAVDHIALVDEIAKVQDDEATAQYLFDMDTLGEVGNIFVASLCLTIAMKIFF